MDGEKYIIKWYNFYKRSVQGENRFESQIKLNADSIVKLSFKTVKWRFTAGYFLLNFFQKMKRKKSNSD